MKRRYALAIALGVSLLAVAWGTVAAADISPNSTAHGSETAETEAEILESDPAQCTAFEPGSEQSIDLRVAYDLAGESPDYVEVAISEEGYGGDPVTIDISDRESRDTVDLSFDGYVESDWDAAAVKVSVYADGAPGTSAIDHAYYAVEGSTTVCDPDPETVVGTAGDENGDDLTEGVVTLQRLEDGERDYTRLDDRGFFEFDDQSLLEPGKFRLVLYPDENGYPPQWGYVEFELEDGEYKSLTPVERGGVYATEYDIKNDLDSSSSPRVAAGEDLKIELDVNRPRNGERVIVETYVYPRGEERGNAPDDVYDHGPISKGPSTLEIDVPAPRSPGEYEVEFVIQTEYYYLDEPARTDTVTVSDLRVVELESPSIETTAPDDGIVAVPEGETVPFEVDAHSTVSELEYEWFVDGTSVGTSAVYEFNAARFEPGERTVSVAVSDGSDRTDDATVEWTADVIPAPTIDRISLDDTRVEAGRELRVEAAATDPSGDDDDLEFRWEFDGETYSGRNVTLTPRRVDRETLTLTVENKHGARAMKNRTIVVENAPPSVERTAPDDEEVVVETGGEETFTVDVINEDAGPVTIDLIVDGKREERGEVEGTSAVHFDRTFAEPGDYDVIVEVTDSHGETDSTSWSVAVGSNPTIERTTPDGSAVAIDSGETLQFGVEATDPDGFNLTYEWYLDGVQVGSGPTLEKTFQTSGNYSLEVEVTDELGYATSHEWQIEARSLRVDPQMQEHTQMTGVTRGEETTLVEVTVSNPDANDRSVRFEIDSHLPSGLEVSTLNNVNTGGQGQYTLHETLEPGESETIRLSVEARESDLEGQTESIEYEVRYHPVDVPDDLTIITQRSIELEIHKPNDSNQEINSTNEADRTSSDPPTAEDDEALPGFGLFSSVAILVITAIALRRRSSSR